MAPGENVRVISGKYRSRPLASLSGLDLRPTSDRLRETLFNVLTAGHPAALEGTVWFDFYAGTGAVGIEALSRGASKVYFVESAPRAANLIRKNLNSLGIEGGFEVLTHEVVAALSRLETMGAEADFIFLDPPYRLEHEYRKSLQGLEKSGLLRPNTLVIAEHDKRFDSGEQHGRLQRYRKLEQGDAALSFYRLASKRPLDSGLNAGST
jgi:16S rRNA (guanine(966)-N(2))-methyltransferase RsmD